MVSLMQTLQTAPVINYTFKVETPLFVSETTIKGGTITVVSNLCVCDVYAEKFDSQYKPKPQTKYDTL